MNTFKNDLIIPLVNRMPFKSHCIFKHSPQRHKEVTDKVK